VNIQKFIDTQKHIIIICDSNFNLKYINKAFFDYFKENRVYEIIDKFKNKPFNVSIKQKFTNFKGHNYSFEVTITESDENIVITMYDITKYSAYKKSLLNSNISFSEYKKLVDKVLIVSKTDTNGIITYVNDHFVKISGYSKKELIGQNHNIVRHPEMPGYIFRNMWNTISQGKIWQGIVKNRKKNGEGYYVRTMIAPLFNENGEIKEYIAFRIDITELIKAKERAQSAKKTKEMFLANMSHEIRTPLTGIIGFIDILKKKSLPEDVQKMVNIISNSADTLLNIVNDILDISKMESEGVTIHYDKFNPKESFENSIKLFIAKAEHKKIKYIYNINVNECIISDEHRLKQVLSNIIGNAIKFTPENGEVRVDIIKSYEDDKIIKVDFSITDTGIGIPKDKIKKLFKPFSQIENTQSFGGTGLGLYISSQIVKKLGGEIKVESEENKGSKFYFSLEFEKCDEVEKKVAQDVSVKGKILIAEDNLVNQEYLKALLKTKGNIQVVIANNGEEAVEYYKKDKFDLVFMDIFMPKMQGEEATKLILEYEHENNLPHTPIIALTANALRGDKEKFLKAGFDGYIAKPIKSEELDNVLNKYLTSYEENNIIHKIAETMNLDAEVVAQLVELYFSNIDNDLNELVKAIKDNDYDKIRNTAHKIAGSSASMQFNYVYNKAKEIEILAKDKKDVDYMKLCEELSFHIQNRRLSIIG